MCVRTLLCRMMLSDKKRSVFLLKIFSSTLYQTRREQMIWVKQQRKCLQLINCNRMKQKRKIFNTRTWYFSINFHAWSPAYAPGPKELKIFFAVPSRRRGKFINERFFFIGKQINKGSYTQEPQSFIKFLSSFVFPFVHYTDVFFFWSRKIFLKEKRNKSKHGF